MNGNDFNCIRLRDALKLMDRLNHRQMPIPFTIGFITADRRRNTGGEFKEISGAILSKHNKALPMHMRRVDGFAGSKKPASHENAQRNIQAPDGSVTKVNIRLIKSFNGMQILW
jgi:hypothetical protein